MTRPVSKRFPIPAIARCLAAGGVVDAHWSRPREREALRRYCRAEGIRISIRRMDGAWYRLTGCA